MAMRPRAVRRPTGPVAARARAEVVPVPVRSVLSMCVLEQAATHPSLTQRDVLLLCLAAEAGPALRAPELRRLASRAGVKPVWSWNVSDVLRRHPDLVLRTQGGWMLTAGGEREARRLASLLLVTSAEAVESMASESA